MHSRILWFPLLNVKTSWPQSVTTRVSGMQQDCNAIGEGVEKISIGADIPFITDAAEDSGDLRSHRGSIRSAQCELSPYAPHSRSPSIRENYIHESQQPRKASSCEDLRRPSVLSNASYHYHQNGRRKTSLRKSRRRCVECGGIARRRKSNVSLSSSLVTMAKRPSVISNRSYYSGSRRGSKYSCIENESPRLSVQYLAPSASRRCSEIPNSSDKEFNFGTDQDQAKDARRQRIVCTIGSTFIFLLTFSVMAVLITLTQSQRE